MKKIRQEGYAVGVKRVRRLLRQMGLMALYPKPRLSQPNITAPSYPYLLTDLPIDYPNQVWCSDITYIHMATGFFYVVAIMDWHSRYVLSWELSNSLESNFCVQALRRALKNAKPLIFNTDQGSQFTASAFVDVLVQAGIQISRDGKGRYLDNIMIERLWRSLKFEDIYKREIKDGTELRWMLTDWFCF